MKNVYSFLVLSIIIMLAISVSSCKKDILKPEESYNLKANNENIVTPIGHLKSGCVNGILVFDDGNDLANTLDKIRNLDYNDLVAFESSMGYSSWGRICADYYDLVDTASILDDSTMIFDHVKKYSDYLILVQEADYSYTYETKFISILQYEIMNQDRLFIVNDTLYKVFNSGFLLTSVYNYSEILTIEEENLNDYIEDDNYVFVEQDNTYQIDDQFKVTPIDVGTFIVKRSTSGKNRLYAEWGRVYRSASSQISDYDAQVQIIPYKKSCGIWFRVKRTITLQNNKLGIDYKLNNTWQRFVYSIPPATVFSRKQTYRYGYNSESNQTVWI